MKTYIYYSQTNRAVEAIVANNRSEADECLNQKLDKMQIVVQDDYVLMVVAYHINCYATGFNI